MERKRLRAISDAVARSLSLQASQFLTAKEEFTGKVNRQGGGVTDPFSPLLVWLFFEETKKELDRRSECARRILLESLKLQERYVKADFLEKLKNQVGTIWNDGIADVQKWHKERVQGAKPEVAKNYPFDPHAQEAFNSIFLDVLNKSFAPGFLVRNKNIIIPLITWLIGLIIGLIFK